MEYSKLADVYEQLSNTSKRLEKINILSQFLKSLSIKDAEIIMLLLQGRVFPVWDSRKLGVSTQIVQKSIAIASGKSPKEIEATWLKTGDLGDGTAELIGSKTQATLFSINLDVEKVFANLVKIASMDGAGAVDQKVKLIAELLTSANSTEAKFIVRTVLEDLRIGLAEGTLRDALVWTFFDEKLGVEYNSEKNEINPNDREEYNSTIAKVQNALDVTNDFAKVFAALSEEGEAGLSKLKLTPGTPIKVMLAQKANDVDDCFERVGKPAQFEFKYDGFRMQIHKLGDDIKIYTRRLEEVTTQFPDVVEIIKTHVKAKDCILDSEAVGVDVKTGKTLPFQSVSQRIKRKYDIHEIAKKLPVIVNVFDCIYHEGENLLNEPLSKRREIIESAIEHTEGKILASKTIVTDDPEVAIKLFDEAKESGNEGLMAKKLDAPYKPGSRVGHMVKLKTTMENVELVIVGAEWGEGKRANWLSSFTLACVDDNGEYLEMGKVGTGIKEKDEDDQGFVTFEQLTNLLKPLIIKEAGKEVQIQPKIVIEVAYEEIQKSPTYSSGYALRFPRLMFIREDRTAEGATSLDYIEELYFSQVKN